MSFFEKDYVRAQATGITYHFYLHGEIGDSEEYVELLDKFKDRLIKVTCNGEITYSIRKSEYQVWNEGYCEVLVRAKTLGTALSAYQAYCRELAA